MLGNSQAPAVGTAARDCGKESSGTRGGPDSCTFEHLFLITPFVPDAA